MDADRVKDILLTPGFDQILDAMGDPHRRLLLHLLNNDELEDKTDVMFRGGDEEGVNIALRHNHLPKLADGRFIEWDRDTGEISKGPRFHEIEPLLELIENHVDELPPGWP